MSTFLPPQRRVQVYIERHAALDGAIPDRASIQEACGVDHFELPKLLSRLALRGVLVRRQVPRPPGVMNAVKYDYRLANRGSAGEAG